MGHKVTIVVDRAERKYVDCSLSVLVGLREERTQLGGPEGVGAASLSQNAA